MFRIHTNTYKYIHFYICSVSACIHFRECIFWINIHTWYIQIHTDTYNTYDMNWYIWPVSCLYFCMYLVCILCIFVCIVCICLYFLQQKLLVASIHTIHTYIYTYAQDTYKYAFQYIQNTYKIHAHTYTFDLWFVVCISVFGLIYRVCICMYVHIMCICCMYL